MRSPKEPFYTGSLLEYPPARPTAQGEHQTVRQQFPVSRVAVTRPPFLDVEQVSKVGVDEKVELV
jgi:hypothetical protein